jgi:hypothetical protein
MKRKITDNCGPFRFLGEVVQNASVFASSHINFHHWYQVSYKDGTFNKI